jgi:hypothetical protein
VRRRARWRRATGRVWAECWGCSDWVAQHTDSGYDMSVRFGQEQGATHAVPARPLALRARPGSQRGPPAAPRAAFAGRQRRPYAILRVRSSNNPCGDAQLGGLAHERRVGESGAVDVNMAGEIQRGVLAELGERGRLRVWARRRGSRAERACPQRRTRRKTSSEARAASERGGAKLGSDLGGALSMRADRAGLSTRRTDLDARAALSFR